MYHTPATELAALAAESVGIDLVEVSPADFGADDVDDAGEQGDAELEPMEAAALREIAAGDDVDLAGVTAGAVESEFQTSRIQGMCDRLGIDLFAPLWQEPGRARRGDVRGGLRDPDRAGCRLRARRVVARSEIRR